MQGGDGGISSTVLCPKDIHILIIFGMWTTLTTWSLLAPALGIGPAYAVYFETEAAELRVEALRRRFDLSHAEARFAALLVAGKSVDDAGADSGLTRASARTYCKRIFARMGARSQSELVRLVLTSVARLDQ